MRYAFASYSADEGLRTIIVTATEPVEAQAIGGSSTQETTSPVRRGIVPTCTRMTINRDWCWRGDNTKPKAKK